MCTFPCYIFFDFRSAFFLTNDKPTVIPSNDTYCKTSNISRTIVDNKIVDHSDVVGASPVGAAPTTSSLST